ncbi:MAG: NAD(+) synthase [Cyclobacteriaceae bacterium]|nr:MAG: NAD(+) synthase [Cyclobacteriaceae bacterium]
MKRLKLAGATLNQTPFDWKGNTENIIEAIHHAKQEGARILCLPELCTTGYGCEDVFLSDWLSESAFEQLLKLKEHCADITVNIGLPLRIDGRTYNGSCVVHNKEILGITLKQNLPNDGVHYEPRWFTPWQAGKVITLTRQGVTFQAGDLIYESNGIRFGIEICEDGWSKEKRPGYNFQKRGVDLILNPSASHFAMGKSSNRESEVALDGSRLFNCVYIFCNLLGNEAGRMIYDGDILFAQKGELIAQNNRLSFKRFNVLTCEIDFEHPQKSEQKLLADSKDRNEELTKAATLALYDYLRKSKAKGFALSLSGGADSSMCAVLVAEMVKRASDTLGWDVFCNSIGLTAVKNQQDAVKQLLVCAYQGSKNSSKKTLEAAQSLATSLGATFYHWSIQDEVDTYTKKIEKSLGRTLTWDQDDIALQNIQARARSPIIWMLANIRQSILLTTSNRSEGDVGYATMDGDTSGSLAPIAGIGKPTILAWLKWAEQELGYTGLKHVNNLQPTAELRPSEKNQTDEDDLMPYGVLMAIERQAILKRKSPLEVFEILKSDFADKTALKNHIRKFFRMWAANQWKRERLAPSFHLDDFNVDPRSWCRFPILSSGFTEELALLEAH